MRRKAKDAKCGHTPLYRISIYSYSLEQSSSLSYEGIISGYTNRCFCSVETSLPFQEDQGIPHGHTAMRERCEDFVCIVAHPVPLSVVVKNEKVLII